MVTQLTDRQQDVYDMVRSVIVKRGYGPTVREIGEFFGIKSPNGVMCHLRALERKGLIIRSPNKSRSIELTNEADRSGNSLPLAGVVKASPTHLEFEPNSRIDFNSVIFEEDRFSIQVSGDALVDAKITDGDYVIFKRESTALPGQLVVARLADGLSVLRYWYPEGDRIRLQAANAAIEATYVRDVRILGVAVAIVRPSL